MIQGDIDTTYQTVQRDLFASGLAAQIGMNAYGVWEAIKAHADFRTGEAFPGVRELMKMTGLASATVQKAIKVLGEEHMLRTRKRGKHHVYVARERMDVRIGKRVICSVVIDYVPSTMRERLAKLKAATEGGLDDDEIWAEIEVIPGPGMTWDERSKTLKGKARADEIPLATQPALPLESPADQVAKLKGIGEAIRHRITS